MNRKVTDYIQEFGTDSVNEEFISKEELKDKINDIDIWHKNGLQLKKEILELVK